MSINREARFKESGGRVGQMVELVTTCKRKSVHVPPKWSTTTLQDPASTTIATSWEQPRVQALGATESLGPAGYQALEITDEFLDSDSDP
jgi:hypothetical protein